MAWQTMYHNESNNTHSEYVNFEHRDASGLSYRSTTAAGDAIYGEGAEGSPAELDPLGGNVGLYSPYFSFNAPPPIEPEYPSLFVRSEDAPMYVNGQLVSFSLDGLEVPASLALQSLANGSATVDYRFTDRTILGQLGIFEVRIPGTIDAATPPGGNPNTAYATNDRVEYFFSSFNWFVPRQTAVDKQLEFRNNASVKAQEIVINNDRCANFLAFLANKTEPDSPYLKADSYLLDLNGNKVTPAPDSLSIALSSLTAFGVAEFEGRISSSNRSGVDGNNVTYAVVRNHNQVIFNNDFYTQSKDDAALTVLHESLHLYSGYSDQALAKAASIYGKKPSDAPKEFAYTEQGITKASKYLQERIVEFCGTTKLSPNGGTVIR